MRSHNRVVEKIDQSRRAWAQALARTAKDLGIKGETYRDVGDGYAVFAGENSPLSFAWGNFYPASVETLVGLYAGRDRTWSAIPAQNERAINSVIAARGKVCSWDQVMSQELGEISTCDPPTGYTFRRSESLEPWIEATKNWFLPEDEGDENRYVDRWRLIGTVPEVRCYLARQDEEVMGSAAAFIHEGAAYILDVSRRSDDQDLSLQIYRQLLCDVADEADFAWAEADYWSLGSLESSGFSVAYSQLTFEVPTRTPVSPDS